MSELEKLFKDIKNQLNQEKLKHRRLKICKYSFEISKSSYIICSNRIIIYFNICYFIYDSNTNN